MPDAGGGVSRYWKWVGPSLESCHGGSGRWDIGVTRSVDGPLNLCRHGIHVCRAQDLPLWTSARLLVVEVGDERIEVDNKVVVCAATPLYEVSTWDAVTARLWAADCAEHVLHLYERHAANPAPRQAIETARRYALGVATRDELDAAWDAAWAAGAAAEADARATVLGAWAAARAVAGADAWAAVRAVARDARNVARDARNAARNAVRDAAWDAELRWQVARLLSYLAGHRPSPVAELAPAPEEGP